MKKKVGMRLAYGVATSTIAIAGLTIGVPGQAIAQPRAAQGVSFNIPAQPLADALVIFGAQSGYQVTVDGALIRAARASGVQGQMPASRALNEMLAGSGFTHDISGNVVTIRPLPRGSDSTTQLAPVLVEGGASTAYGPADGYIAYRSATATKTDTPLIEVPASVSVITAEQIEAQQPKTVTQALRYTPGVTSEVAGGQIIADQLIIRGFQQGTGRLLRDGLRGFPSDYLGWDAPEPYGLERIEVLRGASSVLYGASDPGGQINLVTKRAPRTPLYQVQVQGGSNGYSHAAFDIGAPLDAEGVWSYRLTGLVRSNDVQVDKIHNERTFVAPTFTWRPSAATEFTVLTEYQKQTGNFANALPAQGTVLSNPNGTIPRHRYIGEPDFDRSVNEKTSIGYLFEHKFNDTITVRQNLRYSHVRHSSDELFLLGWADADQRVANRFADSRRGSGDVLAMDNQLQSKFSTGPIDHTLLTGLDYSRIQYSQWQQLGMAAPLDLFRPVYGNTDMMMFPGSDYRQTVQQTGLYLQDQLKFDKKWVLLLGGRYDWVRNENSATWASAPVQNDEKFTGRAGLVYLSDSGLAPYISYSESFLPATGRTFDNRVFKPEMGRQYEIGVKYEPPQSNAMYTLALFDLTKRNVSTPDPANPGFNIQEGQTRSRGVELEAKVGLTRNVDLLASYTWNDVKVKRSTEPEIQGNRPIRVPEHMASVWVDYRLPASGPLAGLRVGGGVRYVGDSYGDRENSFKVSSYTVMDAMVRYEFTPGRGLALSLNASNLFDKKYVASCYSMMGCQYGQGRTMYATMEYAW
ncbi:TonB-dependent siderophore receptor [Bordetella genomosp. 5]|uniref:TonB-dependent siderophore receptor n=1 Tax=Bordetella genomosp. 5 TaxID=1395608 RepID=UPI0020CED159|nr:TonB-dependent siderophore receptor [Bordetella genomosp. 5]